MQSDPGGRTLERALILGFGMQHFLNKCFESEALVTKYTNMLESIPNTSVAAKGFDSGVAQSAFLVKAREACITCNLHILPAFAAQCR